MSNISTLFENLMTYSEVNNKTKSNIKKIVNENDTTLLNLTVELPTETEEITPEDVKVNVGVMNVFQDERAAAEENSKDEMSFDDTKDVTPENEGETDKDEETENNDGSKEESLKIRKEAIRRKRLEAKMLRESKKECEKKDCTDEDDCTDESCKSKLESSSDVEIAKANIRKRVATNECSSTSIKTEAKDKDFVKLHKESLMHLDTKSLNKLFTEFVKENYKNIDKVVITKAMLENKMLKLEGVITNINGESTNISLTNRGFNPIKLENKRFVMDFKDTSSTFGVVKESLKQPFIFTCTLKEGILKFEELKYSYKTMIESKVAEVSGKCTLTEGLFDKSAKHFVSTEFQSLKQFLSLDTESEAHMIDDGLGFKIETNEGDKLKGELKRTGYKETTDGYYYKKHDKDAIIVTFEPKGSLNTDNPEYTVTFSARKKDTKQIKES